MACRVECSVEEDVFEYRVYDDYGIGVIAYAKVTRGPGGAEIKVINVSREYRGRGVGSEVLARIVRDHGDCLIMVETFGYLVGWYERFNFKCVCDKPLIMVRSPGGGFRLPRISPP